MINELIQDPVIAALMAGIGWMAAKVFEAKSLRDKSKVEEGRHQRADLSESERKFRRDILDSWQRCEQEHEETRKLLLEVQAQLTRANEQIAELQLRITKWEQGDAK